MGLDRAPFKNTQVKVTVCLRSVWWLKRRFSCHFGSTRQNWHPCTEVRIHKPGWHELCTRSVMFSSQLNTVVRLCVWFNRAAVGFVWTLWLSRAPHWEQGLLVIGEAKTTGQLFKETTTTHLPPQRNLLEELSSVAPLLACGSCPYLWQVCPALLSPLGFIVQTMREPVHLVLSVMNISPWPGSLAVHCRRWVIHFHNTVNNKHIGSVICVRNYKSGTDFSKGTQVKGDEWTNLNSNATRLRFTHTCQCD